MTNSGQPKFDVLGSKAFITETLDWEKYAHCARMDEYLSTTVCKPLRKLASPREACGFVSR